MLAEDQERLIVEVVHRVAAQYLDDPKSVEDCLLDTLYDERTRLESEPDSRRTRADQAYYDAMHRRLLGADSALQRQLLLETTRRFADEVAGYVVPRVYRLATRMVPPALDVLLNALSPLKVAEAVFDGFESIHTQLHLLGHTDTLVQLAERGTVILVPTHVSNLDSVLVGYTIYRLGLPPFLYGAGLNLFANPLIGFFLRHLGAYKVDRRKHAELYKDVLKTYAGCTMELGYHNLFFPGATRSRSGAVESEIKLGLLGMGLEAYRRGLKDGRAKPDIFVVPCTLNYQLVLEAETLIDDHLKAIGKSRYMLEDDESSRPELVLLYARKLFSLDSPIQLVVSQPLDIFGNPVNAEGTSLDPVGRPVARERYLMRDARLVDDPQRDHQLTRVLAEAVRQAYQRDTVINSVVLVARVVFQLLQQSNPQMDLYRLLRTGGRTESFALTDVYARVEQLVGALRDAAANGKVRLGPVVAQADAMDIVADALAHLSSYHRQPALERRGDRLFHRDLRLLLYYQNRLAQLSIAEQLP